MTDPRRSLEALIRDYADIGARSRVALRVTTGDTAVGYTVGVIGVIRPKRILAITAPTTPDGSLVAVVRGQVLTCRWFSATTVFRFTAAVTRLVFEPIPLIHVELPPIVERRTMRAVPRALCALRALLRAPRDLEAIVVDISTAGARVAVSEEVQLTKGHELVLIVRPKILQRSYEMILRCQVATPVGATDLRHPHVRFYGVNFLDVADNTLLVLHAYVQEHLALETDVLSQLLLHPSKEVAAVE
jgi:hypothetical protein